MTATSIPLRPEKNRHVAAERAEKAEARNNLLVKYAVAENRPENRSDHNRTLEHGIESEYLLIPSCFAVKYIFKNEHFSTLTAQLPMALEELLSEKDSEDELDEDRQMLEGFVDVSTDEKDIIEMWNSFVRNQRVLADGHCPWSCEAFSLLHAAKFSSNSLLRRCFMLFLMKLWNHHLVDGATVDKCLTVVDSYTEPIQLI